MSATMTTEQVLALAPDASSAKSGRELAGARHWVTLGRDERAVWGECQGSAKLPYQTRVDLSGPVADCTCPSRKIPCKHALGLLLLLAGQPAAITTATPPSWVSDWLEARARRAEQRAERAKEPAAPTDTAAAARRADQRQARVSAGLAELDQWLGDLVRRGLAGAQAEPVSYWERMAARLVDAQAPGLARLVREAGGLPATGDGWPERLLERLGRLHLLLEGARRLDGLPAELQHDLRSLIGFTVNQDEVLAGAGPRDRWLLVGQRIEQDDRLRTRWTWLWGEASDQAALLLHFAAGNQAFEVALATGMAREAELVYFPSTYPLRALLKEPAVVEPSAAPPPGYADLAAATAAYAAALARQPWLETFPVLLRAAWLARRDGAWVVRDTADHLAPAQLSDDAAWTVLALSGGQPLPLFGEWDGQALRPLSVWHENTCLGL